MSKYSYINNIKLDGGTVCFNFVNTIHGRFSKPFKDYLIDYAAFLKWAYRVKILNAAETKKLNDYRLKNPGETEQFLLKIKKQREVLYRCFSSIARKKDIDKKLLFRINSLIPKSLCNFKYYKIEKELLLLWDKERVHPEKPFWAIAKSAFDILNEVNFERIKECSECGWIFLDETKNNNRKWCNMKTCGARNKARRFYERRKNSQRKQP